eukprot:2605007-Prorocentrum_lima.AAC.1
MTSSLVGSEMCIRDSAGASPMLPPPRVHPLREPPSAPPAPRQRARERPVSYTHLTLPTICSV